MPFTQPPAATKTSLIKPVFGEDFVNASGGVETGGTHGIGISKRLPKAWRVTLATEENPMFFAE